MCIPRQDCLFNYPEYQNLNHIFKGWKIMSEGGVFPYFNLLKPEKDVWYSASSLPNDSSAKYLPAFHLFPTIKDAAWHWMHDSQSNYIVPVLFSEVVAIGEDDGIRCGMGVTVIAARKILFIKTTPFN